MLTKAKRAAIRRALKDNPGRTNRDIAREIGVSDHTVGSVKAEMISNAQIAHKDRTEASGRKARGPKPASTPATVSNGTVDQVDDPVAILREIAGDPNAPATARVQAAKALLAMQRPSDEDKAAAKVDRVTARALQIIEGGRT